MAQTPATPVPQESALDVAQHALGLTIAKFDPFRFRAWAELGLTTAQLRVLFMMREDPGVTAGELACRLQVTPPTISGIVDRLVKLELVRRGDDASDRRLIRNYLTPQGEKACTRLEQGSDLFMRRILSEMNHVDLEMMIKGLQAFVRASAHVARVEPKLAVVAMPGSTPE